MEAGELEVKKAFEEVTTRNVRAAIDYSNETRRIVRELEKKIKLFERTLIEKDKIIADVKKQLSHLQQQFYNRGTM